MISIISAVLRFAIQRLMLAYILKLIATYRIDDARQIDFAIDNLTDHYYIDALNASLMPASGPTIRLNLYDKF